MFLKLRISNNTILSEINLRYCWRCRYTYLCQCVCVRACDLLAWLNIFRGYTARIIPEKVSHIPSESDSSYPISNERKEDLRIQASVENCWGNDYACRIPHVFSYAAETNRINLLRKFVIKYLHFTLYSSLRLHNKRQTSDRSVSMQSNDKKEFSTNCE